MKTRLFFTAKPPAKAGSAASCAKSATYPYSKSYRLLAAALMFTVLFSACKKDTPEPAKPLPEISNIEIGLNNNEIGTIGEDFHFNMDVVAGGKIDKITVKILQRAGETYSKNWNHEVTWDQYKGLKNTNVHKHFDIPADAAEGKYDFLITVYDENGTKLEEKRAINLYLKENLPVNPEIYAMNILANSEVYYTVDGGIALPNFVYKKDDLFWAPTRLSGVKGDGKMYLLLINKKLNHKPETIHEIDFTKAIVYDVAEHKNMETVGEFTNVPAWKLKVGADVDGNKPVGNPISGVKAWESGTYYYGLVYTNTTFNISIFKYIEIPFEIN